jgi:hypothetical protein
MLCRSLNGRQAGRAAPPAVSGHPSHSAVGGGNRGCALMALQLPCRGAALAVAGCVRTQRVTVARANWVCQRNLRNCCSSERQSRALTGERWRTLQKQQSQVGNESKDAVVVASCFSLFTSCAAIVVVFLSSSLSST